MSVQYLLAMGSKWIIFIVLSQVHFPVQGTRSFAINWKNVTTTKYSPRVKGLGATIDIRNDTSFLSGHAMLHDKLENLKIRIAVDISLPNGDLRRALDYTLDICKAMKMSPTSNIATAFWYEMVAFGDFPKGCPIPANENYTLTDYFLKADKFPPYTPEMTFVAGMTVYFDGKLAAVVNIVSKIEYKKKIKA